MYVVTTLLLSNVRQWNFRFYTIPNKHLYLESLMQREDKIFSTIESVLPSKFLFVTFLGVSIWSAGFCWFRCFGISSFPIECVVKPLVFTEVGTITKYYEWRQKIGFCMSFEVFFACQNISFLLASCSSKRKLCFHFLPRDVFRSLQVSIEQIDHLVGENRIFALWQDWRKSLLH